MKRWLYAGILAVGMATEAWASDQQTRADALMFPEVNFRDTALTAAVDYLRQTTAKGAGDAGAFNLVELYPKAFGEETLVTLSLSNVPFSAVLKYLADSAGLEVVYQDYAIVLKKAEVAAEAE